MVVSVLNLELSHPDALLHADNAMHMVNTTISNENLALIDHHLLVDPRLRIAPFKPLVGVYSHLIYVDVEESDSTMIAVVSGVASKPHRASVAHPHCRLTVFVVGWKAIVVDVVTIKAQSRTKKLERTYVLSAADK